MELKVVPFQDLFGNIQVATLSLEDCILIPHSNGLHSGKLRIKLTTFHSFLSLSLSTANTVHKFI